MTIKVEQRHIKSGKSLDCSRCPVALAASEAFGKPMRANVFLIHSEDGVMMRVIEPIRMAEWIGAFDGGKLVHPFEFEVCNTAI